MSSKFYNKVTEAMQWDGTVEGYAQLCQWVTSFCDQYDLSIQDLSQGLPGASPVVVGLDMSPAAANLVVHSGDYVIRNMRSRPHAVQRDDFERTYGPALTDQQIEACAAAAHQVNKAWCEAHGDMSQPRWQDAPEWQKTSARNGVVGALAGNTPEQSHEGWLAEKQAAGWIYAPVKDPERRHHPCMVPYAQLPPEQQAKDHLFVQTVRAVADALCVPPNLRSAEALAGRLTDKVPQHMREIDYTEHAIFAVGKTDRGILLVMWSDDMPKHGVTLTRDEARAVSAGLLEVAR